MEKSENLQILEGILSRLNLDLTVEEKVQPDEICYYINGEKASSVIGHRGETLDALQYIMSQIVNKDKPFEEHIRVCVDADFYRERRKKTLTLLAKKLAKQAIATGREIELEPMNSYERRIIHSAVQEMENVTTRSDGEGKDRHIVVVPDGAEVSYGGSTTKFRRNGPVKTKSFGYKKRKF